MSPRIQTHIDVTNQLVAKNELDQITGAQLIWHFAFGYCLGHLEYRTSSTKPLRPPPMRSM